jgi:hypothetical protein
VACDTDHHVLSLNLATICCTVPTWTSTSNRIESVLTISKRRWISPIVNDHLMYCSVNSVRCHARLQIRRTSLSVWLSEDTSRVNPSTQDCPLNLLPVQMSQRALKRRLPVCMLPASSPLPAHAFLLGNYLIARMQMSWSITQCSEPSHVCMPLPPRTQVHSSYASVTEEQTSASWTCISSYQGLVPVST